MCSVLTRRPHALMASVFSTGEDWGVNGLVKVWGYSLPDRCVARRESSDPRWIVTYFAVSTDRESPSPNAWSSFWTMEFAAVESHVPPARWPFLCCSLKSSLSSTRLFIATLLPSLSENPLHIWRVLFFCSTHSSSSRFSLCHLHCLHTLAWFTKKLCTAARTQSFVRSHFSEHS